MTNAKKQKIVNLKIVLGMALLLFLAILIVIGFIKKSNDKNENLDYKLGIIGTDGMALVSISNERKMINVLNLGSEVDVWVPNGISWVNSTKIKNILEQEKKIDLSKDIFWYNFGFLTDKILFLNSVNDWEKDSTLINNLGFLDWVKYKINYGKMLLKREKLNGNLVDNNLFLSEIMVRDFSESKLNNEELRLSIFNNTSESGLANFMTKRLEWSGFSVVSADNNDEKIDKCLIVYGDKVDQNYGWKMINEIFDCDKKYDQTLNENELQLYFGDKFASMIKYSSYTNN
jgi:hypothetical protein